MELDIHNTIYIDVDGIIRIYRLKASSTDKQIEFAVNDYVSGLDDVDYYCIGETEIQQIIAKIKNRLNKED